MKAKYIYKYLMISFAALLLGSCSSPEVEAKFDQNATDRLSGRQKELNDVLLSSSEGWKAVYYTDSTQLGGWTHLFKFLPEGKVDMASDFDDDTSIHRSQYDIQLGSTVSLVFTTQNRIHLLSDASNFPTSELYAKGYLGDFQFFYYGQKNGEIIFRTNRNGHELHFVKAAAKDWTDLAKNTPILEAIAGDELSPLYRLLQINDGTAIQNYDFEYNSDARFGLATSLAANSNDVLNIALAFTPTGATVKPALVVKGQKLTNFVYDGASNTFIATGTGGVTATIKFSNAPPRLTNDYKIALPPAGSASISLGYIAANLSTAPTNSPLCLMLLDEINAGLPAAQKVNRIQFTFSPGGATDIMYSFTGGKATVYHRVIVTEDAVNKTIILTPQFWHNGTAIIAAQPFLKNIDDKLVDPKGLYVKKESFKITYSNVIYTFTSASSSFRITTYQF
jgi:hypothetical protein